MHKSALRLVPASLLAAMILGGLGAYPCIEIGNKGKSLRSLFSLQLDDTEFDLLRVAHDSVLSMF